MAAIPEDALGLRSLVDLTREEHIVHSDEMPWIPYPGAEGVFVKPLRLNRRTGVWANLTKVVNGGMVNRHYHVGPVTASCSRAAGTTPSATGWRGPARSSMSRLATSTPSSPAKRARSPCSSSRARSCTWTSQDNVVGHDDVLSHMRMYHEFCRQEGIEPLDLDF